MTEKKQLYMKRALAIVCFFALFLCTEEVVAFFVLPIHNLNAPRRLDRDAHEGQITDVLLGASMTADSAISERLEERLGGTFFNLGSNAQSMRLSYYVFRDVLANNPIQRVFIEVSVNRMSRDVEADAGLVKASFFDYLATNDARLLYMRENYQLDDLPGVVLLSARCQLKFATRNIGTRLRPDYIMHYLKSGYGMNPDVTDQYAGKGFTAYDKRMRRGGAGVEAQDPADAREVYHTPEGGQSLEELTRIIALCREMGVEPFLYTVPCAETWQLSYRDSYDDAHDYLMGVAEDFGVPYYDFNLCKPLLAQLDDTYFIDPEHLNKYGAAIFTEYLADMALGELTPNQFYGSFEESLHRIDRVAGLGVRIAGRGKARRAVATARMGPDIEAEYRFLLAPRGGHKADFQVIRDYAPEAELDLSGIPPGRYTLRAEARSAAHPSRGYDAFATAELQIG